MQLSQNETFRVRFNVVVTRTDARAIDVLYHRKCWAMHVTNVLRKDKVTEDGGKIDSRIAHTASNVSFICTLLEALAEGKVFYMGTLDSLRR